MRKHRIVCGAAILAGCVALLLSPIAAEQFAWETPVLSEEKAPILDPDLISLLPKRWYAGDHGKKPMVRSQGKYGTCWAMTAVSALEAILLPEQDIVFSADHMARRNAFTVDIEDGGDYLMTMAYFSGWQGPVTEEEDPYGDEYSPEGLEAAVHVQEMQILTEASLNEVKRAVYEYGAVQTSLYLNRSSVKPETSYYNSVTSAYYDPDVKTPNHDVLILGWDDSFSRLKFAQLPPTDGAFICQNTWGSDFGDDGIFYVSYADANVMNHGILYSKVESSDNYDHIYQMDDCGWQGTQGYGNGTCWMSGVYTAGSYDENAARSAEKTETELLSAVGFYAASEDVSYEMYLVHDFSSEQDFERMSFLQSGSFKRAGYYTVDLKDTVELEYDERFAVVIKMTSPYGRNLAAVEYRANEYTQNVTLEGKESYLSQYGEVWENTQERFGTNVCLKVYTRCS